MVILSGLYCDAQYKGQDENLFENKEKEQNIMVLKAIVEKGISVLQMHHVYVGNVSGVRDGAPGLEDVVLPEVPTDSGTSIVHK